MQGVIKVADFGLTEDVYATRYYREEKSKERSGERVPIRWMPPESIENSIYNVKTDVVSAGSTCINQCIHLHYSKPFHQWAFGVTCWEIFTCGRVPYHGISAMGLLYALKDGERLEKPNNAACSDEM